MGTGLTAALVEGYASLFVGCWEYYAVQQRDGSYRPSRSRLSSALLASHLMGRFTLGTYIVDLQGNCSFAVLDADDAEQWDVVLHLVEQLGVPVLLEQSRRGGHAWIFFDQPTPAWMVRAWLLPFLGNAPIELYPKQDQVQLGGMGSLIRLPLGIHRKTGERYPFLSWDAHGALSPVSSSVVDCARWAVTSVQRVTVPESVAPVPCDPLLPLSPPALVSCGQTIRQWCQSQDIAAVIGRYTDLNRLGVGRCPLPGHHARGDVHPSFQVFGGADPHWYCYTWRRAGNVFDFLCCYHGLTVQQAWEQLVQGALS